MDQAVKTRTRARVKQSPQNPCPNLCRNRWAIVLAAGEGRRLASVTRFLYGREVPKQFAALDGERTLLQQTIDRLGALVPPERTVVVVAADRQELAASQLSGYRGIQIVCQPANVGTGPGVMLPMALIKAQDPTATVVVTPSDHHIPGENAFVTAVERAIATVDQVPSGLVLLGAEAKAPAVDLGWILPRRSGDAVDDGAQLVESFVEKPSLAAAKRLFTRGALWNTLVVVGNVEAFWSQARNLMPKQTALFDDYVAFTRELGAAERTGERPTQFLAELYRSMPAADFSRAVLQNVPDLRVVRLRESGWCDCGTPERLLTCINDQAERHPQVLQAILRAIQAEQRLQPMTVTQGG